MDGVKDRDVGVGMWYFVTSLPFLCFYNSSWTLSALLNLSSLWKGVWEDTSQVIQQIYSHVPAVSTLWKSLSSAPGWLRHSPWCQWVGIS